MTKMDRLVTALVLMLSSTLVVLFLAGGLLELGKVERQDRLPRGTPVMDRNLYVQGNWLTIRHSAKSVIAPVVLTNGTLDPAYPYDASPVTSGRQESVAFFLQRSNLRTQPIPEDLLPTRDYRRARTWSLPQAGRDSWLFAPDLGILRIGEHGRIEGSLTDEGWTPERRACESFKRVLLPLLDGDSPFPFPTPVWKYGVARGPAMVYLTPDGIYRADLVGRKIVRMAAFEGPEGAFVRLGGDEGSKSFVVTSRKIHWIEVRPPWRTGTQEIPESILRIGDFEVAGGTEDRLIFRAEVPGSRARGTVCYHVAVADAAGSPTREYEYAFPSAQGTPKVLEPDPSEWWDEVLNTTMGGRFCAAITPLAWKGALLIPTRKTHRWYETVFEVDLDRELLAGYLWLNLLVPLLLVAIVIWRERPHARGWSGPILWGAFVLAFGIPAAFTWWILGGRERTDRCPGCARSVSARFAACPRCGARAGVPRPLGIEILQPVDPSGDAPAVSAS